MTARAGMTDIIATLRSTTEAGTSEWTLGAVTFWSDDELQRVLDRHRTDIVRLPLAPVQSYAAGAVVYLEYRSGRKNLEASTAFELEDSTGVTVSTALYTVDYANGIVTFAADTTGLHYYMTARSYDLEAAAADVWRMKASHYATAYDVSADGQSYKRSQLYDHCLAMAEYYGGVAAPTSVFMERWD